MPGALRALDVSFVAAPSGAQLRSTVGCSYLRVCRGILLGFTACKFSRLNQDPPDITTSADPIEDWHPIPEFFFFFFSSGGFRFFPFSLSVFFQSYQSCYAQLCSATACRMCPPGFSEAWLTWVSQQILNMRLFYHVLSIGLY